VVWPYGWRLRPPRHETAKPARLPDRRPVGQRQTRAETAPNIVPTARLNGRIANRVQLRMRNRIDRYYDPQANAASPFEVAGDQARAVELPAPR